MAKKSNNLAKKLGITQYGNIKVHTQILNDLSSGIYSSPASCIKELVNNSYDAEATLVTIRLMPLQNHITILDDGVGMNYKDFDENFAWISKSNKRNSGENSPKFGRPLIGKIGIGFIAVNEICEKMEISSSKAGENFKFTAVIDFKQYLDNAFLEEITPTGDDVEENEKGIIKATYEIVNEEEDVNEHYTFITLLGLKEGIKFIFEGKQFFAGLVKQKNRKKDYDKNFFPNMKALMEHHFNEKLKSFDEDNEYVKFALDLASYIPVEYIQGGPIEGIDDDEIISDIVENMVKLKFKVDLDGIYLKKPILFPETEGQIKYKSFNDSIQLSDEDSISFKGYFFIKHGIIFPVELNGIALRIKTIPIAPHYGFDRTFLNYPNYLNQLFRNWLAVEIYVDKGLETAMNIDRVSFRLTHPHYLAIQSWLHKYMNDVIFDLALDLYNEGKENRDIKKKAQNRRDKKRILNATSVEVKVSPSKNSTAKYNPISVKKTTGRKVSIHVDENFSKKFSKKDWLNLEDVFIIFELAFNAAKGDTKKLKDEFYRMIEEWKS